jgi:HK97 family phage major capsid protein
MIDQKALVEEVVKSVSDKMTTLKDEIRNEVKSEITNQIKDVNSTIESKLKNIKVNPVADVDNNFGYTSMGKLLIDIAKSTAGKGSYTNEFIDRVKNFSYDYAKGNNESVDTLGGFLVPPEFANKLITTAIEETDLLKRCSKISTISNQIEIPYLDDRDRSAGKTAGGIDFYWMGEKSTFQEAQPTFKKESYKLDKLGAVCLVTEELLEDAPAMESIVSSSFNKGFSFFTDNAIVRGNGVAKLEGILNSPALKTVAIENAQTEAIKVENLIKMKIAFMGKNGIWLINPDMLVSLMTLTIGQMPIFIPAGSLANREYDMLLGYPIVWSEHNSVLKAVGDIMLVDMKEYQIVSKSNMGLKSSASVHVNFMTDQMTYKFVTRMAGKTIHRAVYKPANSQGTKSPFVTLAAR